MDDVLDEAPCGFLSFDDAGTILLANTTLARMLGYQRDALIGLQIDALLPVAARLFYNTHFFPLLKLHDRAEEIYLTLRCGDGEEVPTVANAVRRQRSGQTVNDCVVVPMRQRHEFERQLVLARQAAEEAGTAREKFLSVMSHELRSPLTGIVGFAELLERGARGPLTESQLAAVRRITNAARYMATLIDDILTFAGLRRGEATVRVTDVSVAEGIERAMSLVAERAEAQGMTVEREPVAPPLTIRADPRRLQQILLNLLTNAIKFTPPGGTITVAAEAAGDTVLIRLRDTGPGIAEEMQGRIFEPFVQGQREPEDATEQQGVGLGLAISRDLAREMGGDLTVESRAGHGSQFTLTLARSGI